MQTATIQEVVLDTPKATIKIEARTRDRLKALGRMDDTFDSVIAQLIDEHEEHQKEKDQV